MAEIKVAIRNTFILDVDEVLLRVTPLAPMAQIRKALRGEIKYLIGEMCDRVMSTPDFSETYFAHYLCREGLADPRPGWEPPRWDEILRDRAEFGTAA